MQQVNQIDQLDTTPEVEELVLSRAASVKPYMDAFVKWCQKHTIAPTVPRLIEWDELHNHSKIQSFFGTVEQQLEIARKTIYNAIFYAYFRVQIEVMPQSFVLGNKEYAPDSKVAKLTISSAQGGVYLPNISQDERKFLISKTKIELRNIVNKLTAYNYPLSKFLELAQEAAAGL